MTKITHIYINGEIRLYNISWEGKYYVRFFLNNSKEKLLSLRTMLRECALHSQSCFKKCNTFWNFSKCRTQLKFRITSISVESSTFQGKSKRYRIFSNWFEKYPCLLDMQAVQHWFDHWKRRRRRNEIQPSFQRKGEKFVYLQKSTMDFQKTRRNSRIQDMWGREEKTQEGPFPFQKGKAFNLLIYSEESKIMVNEWIMPINWLI